MDFMDAQDDLVRAIVASIDAGDWRRLVVDVEILEHPEGYQIDAICLAVVPEDGDLGLYQFDLSPEASEAVAALYRQRQEAAGEVIGGFELTVDPPGRFRFDFVEGRPRRIDGDWDEARANRLTCYLDVYRAEQVDGGGGHKASGEDGRAAR